MQPLPSLSVALLEKGAVNLNQLLDGSFLGPLDSLWNPFQFSECAKK